MFIFSEKHFSFPPAASSNFLRWRRKHRAEIIHSNGSTRHENFANLTAFKRIGHLFPVAGIQHTSFDVDGSDTVDCLLLIANIQYCTVPSTPVICSTVHSQFNDTV